METLIFFASPNKKGNTYNLLKNFLKGLNKKADIIDVYSKKIFPCIDCKKCHKDVECAITDDMTEIYDKIDNSKLVVFAFPMYFSSIPAPMKTIIDRFQVYWSKKYIREDREDIKEKKGVILATAGSYTENMFSSVEEVLGQAFAVIDAKDIYKVYVANTDEEPANKNKQALNKATELGATLKNIMENNIESDKE